MRGEGIILSGDDLDGSSGYCTARMLNMSRRKQEWQERIFWEGHHVVWWRTLSQAKELGQEDDNYEYSV